MASLRKMPTGKWGAEVVRNGLRKSKVFATKTAAKEWAAREEYLILNNEVVAAQSTFGDAMRRYAEERSTEKSGARWEQIRLAKFSFELHFCLR